jgi:hypothetical protein
LLDTSSTSDWLVTSSDLSLEHVSNNDGMTTLPHPSICSPHRIDYLNAAEVPEQQAHTPETPDTSTTPCLLPPNGRGLSTSRARVHKNARQLKCDFRDCTHTFPRTWELKRRIETKHHVGAKAFLCRAERCLNKQLQLPWTFVRSDKLTAHIKATHDRDTIFAGCPINGCDFGRCTLETLGIHIKRSHTRCEEGCAVLNASTCKVRKCPLWQCGKHLKAHELPGHVAGHAKDDVLAARSGLEPEGLIVTIAPGPAQTDHSKCGLVVAVSCPICDTMCGDSDDFTTHLWATHLFPAKSSGVAHFVAWRSTWAANVRKENANAWACLRELVRADINNVKPWTVLKRNPNYMTKVETIRCPSCLLSFSGLNRPASVRRANMKAVSAHHLSLLRPEADIIAELYPHRLQILRLYPEFVSHPVFADFDKPQDGIASSS